MFITATSVGYGDYSPQTELAAYINCIVITIDVLTIMFILGLIVDFIAVSAEKTNNRRNELEV